MHIVIAIFAPAFHSFLRFVLSILQQYTNESNMKKVTNKRFHVVQLVLFLLNLFLSLHSLLSILSSSLFFSLSFSPYRFRWLFSAFFTLPLSPPTPSTYSFPLSVLSEYLFWTLRMALNFNYFVQHYSLSSCSRSIVEIDFSWFSNCVSINVSQFTIDLKHLNWLWILKTVSGMSASTNNAFLVVQLSKNVILIRWCQTIYPYLQDAGDNHLDAYIFFNFNSIRSHWILSNGRLF